jgi:hypothetical protein
VTINSRLIIELTFGWLLNCIEFSLWIAATAAAENSANHVDRSGNHPARVTN